MVAMATDKLTVGFEQESPWTMMVVDDSELL